MAPHVLPSTIAPQATADAIRTATIPGLASIHAHATLAIPHQDQLVTQSTTV